MRVTHVLCVAVFLQVAALPVAHGAGAEGEEDLGAIEHPDMRALLQRARKAEQEGRAEEALEIYAEAYAKFPVSVVAAEAGLAELRAGRHLQAARHLRWALSLGHYPFSHRPIDYLLEKLGEAKRMVGTLQVRTNVDRARLTVDGTSITPWPAITEVYMEPGEHKLALTREGFWNAETTVKVNAGETKDVFLAMEERTMERVIQLPRPILASLSNQPPAQPGESKTLLYVSAVGLGLSLAAGITGYAVKDTGEKQSDAALTNAGLGLLIGGGIGLGLSVTGLVIAIAARPQPQPVITISPQVAKGHIGLGAQGSW